MKELTYGDAALLLGKLTTTLGGGSEANHFLPRVLETLAHGGHYLHNALPRNLERGREAGWTSEQVAAVCGFFSALFAAVNELSYNYLWYVDLDWIVDELQAQLPECADQLRLTLHDPEAGAP